MLVVFYVPSTARSFRDDTPIYCPLLRMWSSVFTPFPPGIEPQAVVWQSITLPLCQLPFFVNETSCSWDTIFKEKVHFVVFNIGHWFLFLFNQISQLVEILKHLGMLLDVPNRIPSASHVTGQMCLFAHLSEKPVMRLKDKTTTSTNSYMVRGGCILNVKQYLGSDLKF